MQTHGTIPRIIDDIRQTILPVLLRHQVRRAGIFGSVATGAATPDSDVDIVVELPEGRLSLLDFVGIQCELEDALGTPIDLVEYKAIKPRLRERIMAEEVRIYG
jgi:uncharacterized protein